jgi:hypothetical protein
VPEWDLACNPTYLRTYLPPVVKISRDTVDCRHSQCFYVTSIASVPAFEHSGTETASIYQHNGEMLGTMYAKSAIKLG